MVRIGVLMIRAKASCFSAEGSSDESRCRLLTDSLMATGASPIPWCTLWRDQVLPLRSRWSA
jgi:hypothetical protein